MKKLFSDPIFLATTLLIVLLFGIAGFHFEMGFPPMIGMVLGIIIGIVLLVSLKLLISLAKPVFKTISIGFLTTFLSGLLALVILKNFAFRWPTLLFYLLALWVFMCFVLLILGFKKVKSKKNGKTGWVMIIASLVIVVLGLYGFNSLDGDPYLNTKTKPETNRNSTMLSEMGIEDPSQKGLFQVETFTYGSGTDEKRPEYTEGVKIKTPTVDASRILPDWKGKKKKWREKFWGFGVENFPLNGRVYMPKGDGPFPLVLMVHGNHSMIDYSDAGYAYLGELLASRGAIAVSVDENFINAHWSGDFRGKEMPARGWLLLKHLEQWKNWNDGGNSDLAGKVDMDHIVLVGHSRGGEAVSIAAAYNELERFPDNAQETFNFGFGIKGIITVAPTDYRYEREITLKNINYLSLQGAYDSDEVSFWGMRPYHRLQFSDDFKGFKAGVYMNHANHGQFNSTWGRSDFGAPMKWLLNLKPLVSGEDQRQMAKVYVSAFVETVLKDNNKYLNVFKSVDGVKDWLPGETYLSQYADASKKILLDFEDDIDVTTGKENIQLSAENFKIWREEGLLSRDNEKRQNNALVLGWKYGSKATKDSLPQYHIHIPDTLKDFGTMDTLALSIGVGNISELDLKEKEKDFSGMGFNFSVVFKDSLGNTASVDLASTTILPVPIRSKFTKFKFLDKEMIGSAWEVQMKSCYVPIASVLHKNNSLDVSRLKTISLVFDKDSLGIVVVDDIGVYGNSMKEEKILSE
ncbi:MFS transporter [Muricauda sp. MAR_2010_75]|uniref:MFS transporter n=1 Tax=Allomuricauda sp. MAR_2010_75 TaxID=1250232 RepID=UPI00068FC58A|nr:MFS transporter [Muricauda sp. MAR_2010_75]